MNQARKRQVLENKKEKGIFPEGKIPFLDDIILFAIVPQVPGLALFAWTNFHDK